MLNIQRLWLLQQLASAGTISRVAALEGLTRPAVSQQLAQLERETSLVLLEREGRGVRLTSSALELLESAKPLFTALSEVEGHLESQREGVAGELRISAFPSVTTALLPSAMRLIREQMPRLRVSVMELEPADAFQGIAANRLDVAVVDDISLEPENSLYFEHEPYLVDHLFVVVPEDHPLAAQEKIDLKSLEREQWLLSTGASRFTNLVLDECHRIGFDPLVVGRCHQVLTIIELVRSGFGVTLLPGLSLSSRTDGIAVRPLTVPIVRRIHIAYRRGRRKQAVVSAAIDALHESVGMLEELP